MVCMETKVTDMHNSWWPITVLGSTKIASGLSDHSVDMLGLGKRAYTPARVPPGSKNCLAHVVQLRRPPWTGGVAVGCRQSIKVLASGRMADPEDPELNAFAQELYGKVGIRLRRDPVRLAASVGAGDWQGLERIPADPP